MAEDLDNADEATNAADKAGGSKKEASGKPGGKGKLLVIVLLAIALGGGGFFGMKVLRGGKHGPVKLKVGKVVTLKEFLVNLTGSKPVWLKTEIALGIAEGMELGHGGGHEGGGEDPPEVRDAINMLLMSKSAKDLATVEGKEQLKREIIQTLNKLLSKEHGSPAENLQTADNGTHSPDKESEGETNSGPVLEVYFISFAMQEN